MTTRDVNCGPKNSKHWRYVVDSHAMQSSIQQKKADFVLRSHGAPFPALILSQLLRLRNSCESFCRRTIDGFNIEDNHLTRAFRSEGAFGLDRQ
jgi:hypothetical protein